MQKNITNKKNNRTSLNCTTEDLARIKKQATHHGRSEVGHLRKMMDKEDEIISEDKKQ